MTSVDIENLFEYLKIHHEHNPKVHNRLLMKAWLELLEPYAPADVKAALIATMRESRHFPDCQDVAVKCAQTAATQSAPQTPAQPSRASIEEFHATYRRLKEEGKI
ncbi:hypothetical protein KL86CLO1_11662 [uncultured Eubacteriales bacterium]|uniref:Replicative helicase inhibitor G39P N-terminal domain-containing protein n=1 Tax=uncultured Eubacteriales bacterium TaxID=172733 RepID=A0A212JT45_9FIRM|nr:hypothetical protein KL86CLO1_11662 [uncultured Eubacteriales bacterium]